MKRNIFLLGWKELVHKFFCQAPRRAVNRLELTLGPVESDQIRNFAKSRFEGQD